MPRATILDPNRAEKQAEELQNKLRSLIIGQNEAVGTKMSLGLVACIAKLMAPKA